MDYIQSHKDGIEFRDCPRGQYIMAQALYLGIQALYQIPEPYREVSNAMDMKFLLETLHPYMAKYFEQVGNFYIQAPTIPIE